MLTDYEFLAWCDRRQLPQEAIKLIKLVRSHASLFRGDEVSRVVGRFSSGKMQQVIPLGGLQFESVLKIYEDDDDVLEFYSASASAQIYLDYFTKTNRRAYHPYIPDFFVIRENGAGWEDWKSEQDLLRSSERSPNRWQREGSSWRHLPGEDYARKLNLFCAVHLLKPVSRTRG